MESQVKERLVGAIVLVAVGVWLIPMVLDGPDRAPVDENPGLELPAVDETAPIRTRTVDLDRDSRPEPVVPDSPPREQAIAVVEPPGSTVTDRAGRSGAEDTTARVAANEAAPSAGAPTDEDDEPATARRDAEPASDVGPGSADAGRTATASRPEATTAAAAPGEWMVQLGSFGERANADRLVERVATYGYSARVLTHVAGGATLYRVRLGGYASRNQAEAAIASLAAHGFVAQVVAPE